MTSLPRYLRMMVPPAFRSGGLVRSLWTVGRHFFGSYGWYRSFRAGRCVRRDGSPIPWFTYPAIDYLDGLDLKDKTVFEWGSGYSTLFWGARCKSVMSVEHFPDWAERVRGMAPANCEIHQTSSDVGEYCGIIDRCGSFDIIVVDGLGEARLSGCRKALEHLSEKGMIILDNSDLWEEAAAFLRQHNLIQVDFTGFSPLNVSASATSFFLRRDFDFAPKDGVQPHPSVAQPVKKWEGIHAG